MRWRPGSAVHRSTASRRRGAVALELLISVPVLVVMILAVIEFSMMFVAAKQVAIASRLGAKAASESADVSLFVNSGQLRALVDRQLATAGSINGACRVIAESGVGNAITEVENDGAPACNCTAPGTAGPMTGPFVRITVGVRLSEFVPNLLSPYGFSITDRVLTHTTTFRREIP